MSKEHAASSQEVERLIAGVPEELQAYPQFVVWTYREVNGRVTKPPINPTTGKFADPTNPDTWGTFQQALRAVATGKVAGIGFVFSENDPFCGIDLDHVIAAGQIVPSALETVTALDSYTELSPSGTGLHIIVQGALPGAGRRKENTEVYDRGRFFTLTAQHLTGTPTAIVPRQEALETLYQSLAVSHTYRL